MLLETALAAARAAGEIVRERFARPHQVSHKGLRNLVTEVDLLAQEAIVAQIRARFPEHQIETEESPEALGGPGPYRWYIDPLDGTTNYARGIPYFSVSVAVEQAGRLVAGVVYEPLGDRLFHAEAGGGAYLNGARLQVSPRTQLIDALLDLGWARGQEARLQTVQIASVLGPLIGSARTMGSAALGLAAVAAGWEDVFFHPELESWDMAAGVLLIREAGGVATTLRGETWHAAAGNCLATNGHLQAAVLQAILPVLGRGRRSS